MIRVGLAFCLSVITLSGSLNFAHANDERQASRFFLNSSNTEHEVAQNEERTRRDLALIANLIFGCDVEFPSDTSQITHEFLERVQDTCPKTVIKWPSNVEFWIGGTTNWLRDNSSDDARFVLDALRQLGEKAGVNFEPTLFRPSAELYIFPLSEDEKELEREELSRPETKPSIADAMRPFLNDKGSGCVGMLGTSENGVLTEYLLVVDAERNVEARHQCIAESLVRLMGLAGNYADDPLIELSQSADGDRVYRVSSIGKRTLELLYSDWLLSGANLAQAFNAYLALPPTKPE